MRGHVRISRRATAALLLTTFVATTAVACSLQDGGIQVLSSNDAEAATDGALADSAAPRDATSSVDSGSDATSTPDSADAGPAKDYVFAATGSHIYSFEVHARELHDLGPIAGCGVNGDTYDSVDLAQDSAGLLHLLTWQAPKGLSPTAHFSYYAVEPDGGCVDVHGGPGSATNGTMWGAYQGGANDTLFTDFAFYSSIAAYNGNGNYLSSVNNVFPTNGATADIACTSTVCYSALKHDHCPSDAGANDCLFSFKTDGSNQKQIGDFGKAGVAGLAYQGGLLYGFCTDGSIVEISTTMGSTGTVLSVNGASTSGLVWEGAASSSGND